MYFLVSVLLLGLLHLHHPCQVPVSKDEQMRFLQEARSRAGRGGRGRGRGRGKTATAKAKAQPKAKAKAKSKSKSPKAKAKSKAKAKAKETAKPKALAAEALPAGGNDEDEAREAKPVAKAKAKGKAKARAGKGGDNGPKDPLAKRLFHSPVPSPRRPIFNTPLRRRAAQMHSPGVNHEPQPNPRPKAPKKSLAGKSEFLQKHEKMLPATFGRRARPSTIPALERYARIVMTFRERLLDTVKSHRSVAEAWLF